jgi:3-deoxy-D-manno-octulosonic-acid transferase
MMNFIASARALEAGGGGVMVKDSEDLFARLSEFLGDEEARARIDSNAFNVIMRNAGATERAHRIFKESSL